MREHAATGPTRSFRAGERAAPFYVDAHAQSRAMSARVFDTRLRVNKQNVRGECDDDDDADDDDDDDRY